MEFDHIETIQQDNGSHCIANTDEIQPLCRDHRVVISSIEEKILALPPIEKECCIYRVPKSLFDMNPSAYVPQVISIGPFHHGKRNLVKMEQHKLRFLDRYLKRAKTCVKEAIKTARKCEGHARMCYAEPVNMDSNKFVKMMLVDGCFIVEYLITFYVGCLSQTEKRLDPQLYRYRTATNSYIYRDLTMLENQLPFFVLHHLFELLPHNEKEKEGLQSLIQLAHNFSKQGFLENSTLPGDICTQKVEVKHLVDFLSFYFVPSFSERKESRNKRPVHPPSVSKLCEACVKIKRATEYKCLMDIRFKDGVLEIPHFEIDNCYEITVRNMMAYEHYCYGVGKGNNRNEKYVIQYISFLDKLISTREDAGILMKEGIITWNGGRNKDVWRLFNGLRRKILLPHGPPWHFDHISKDLCEHCEIPWNRWMASLRRNNCNTPWAITILILAAIFLLLTFLQTLLSALSFHTT